MSAFEDQREHDRVAVVGTSWQSYPSIFNLGHKAVERLFDVECYVEEKVDGSQFSFGMIDAEGTGPRLRIRSKNVEMYTEAPAKMFAKAAEYVQSIAELLTPGWTYRGEFLAKPSHNSLAYERVPKNHIALFDVTVGDGEYGGRSLVEAEAARLGLEPVPLLLDRTPTLEELRAILDTTESMLGAQKIEGVVIKQAKTELWAPDKKPLIGKFVSERFREVHKQKWGENNPSRTDSIEKIASEVCTVARWEKAIAHVREQGLLEDSPRDIGLLMKEIPLDVEKEEQDYIKDRLYKVFMPEIRRRLTAGFPQWYKERLMEKQFDAKPMEVVDGE